LYFSCWTAGRRREGEEQLMVPETAVPVLHSEFFFNLWIVKK
jgi:hypothetical protein